MITVNINVIEGKLEDIVEYDEAHHKRRAEKDTQRMKEIKEYLKCRFLRYDAVKEELKEY